jgi:predicted O-methyltransferase YrrM
MADSPQEPGTDLVKHVADEVTPEITAFMGTVAGTPSFQLGELVGDEIKLWRFKPNLRHAQRAKEMLDAAGLQAHQVPFRTLVPLIESASLEDDDELTERWAALLANAASGQQHVPPSFPNVLRELEPTQAQLLDRLYQATMSMAPELRRTAGITAKAPGDTTPDLDYHADNLRRLRLADTPSHNIDP